MNSDAPISLLIKSGFPRNTYFFRFFRHNNLLCRGGAPGCGFIAAAASSLRIPASGCKDRQVSTFWLQPLCWWAAATWRSIAEEHRRLQELPASSWCNRGFWSFHHTAIGAADEKHFPFQVPGTMKAPFVGVILYGITGKWVGLKAGLGHPAFISVGKYPVNHSFVLDMRLDYSRLAVFQLKII